MSMCLFDLNINKYLIKNKYRYRFLYFADQYNYSCIQYNSIYCHTIEPFGVVLCCTQWWETTQAAVDSGVSPRKVHGGSGIKLPAGGDEGRGVVEWIVGTSSHAADLIVDLCQICQLCHREGINQKRKKCSGFFLTCQYYKEQQKSKRGNILSVGAKNTQRKQSFTLTCIVLHLQQSSNNSLQE